MTSGSPRRSGSLAARLALGTVLLIACITTLLVVQLTRQEWQRVLESKRSAAQMVTRLFASSVGAALDFDDVDAVKTALEGLRSNREIIYAAVFAGDAPKPLAEYEARAATPGEPSALAEGVIDVIHPVHNPGGTAIGSVLIRVSLEHEEKAFRQTRARLMGFGALFAIALASLLVVVMRRVLVLPLLRLQAAAMRLAVGERVVVPEDRDDELGTLSHTFNSMATRIDERERRIATQNRRLQNLFDNMGQAIVVFGADGILTEEQSRSAERWLEARPGSSVVDALYPEDEALEIERQAFQAWLEAAFASPVEQFRELLELAPASFNRQVGTEMMHFDLVFRLAEQAGSERQIMLLATDVTERRRLESAVLEKDREHERQLTALRRLATGGGELFVGFLDNTRRRLRACEEILGSDLRKGGSKGSDRSSIEAMFRHLHTIRAEARCFDLPRLESAVAALETRLARIREGDYLLADGEEREIARAVQEISDLLGGAERSFVEQSPLGAVALDQMTVRRSRLLLLADTVGARDGRVSRLVEELTARPAVESFALLPEAAARWAERTGKKVRLEIEHGGTEIPFALSRILGGVLSHFVRNAIAHGIEPEEERLARGKPAIGSVRLSAELTPEGPIICVADDGRGLDVHGLGQRSRALGLDTSSAFEAALAPGVSTSSERSEISGDGVGLAAAESELEAVGYEIQLTSTSDQGTSFTLAPAPRRRRRVQERHVG